MACHDVHGTPNDADRRRPANILCLQCRGPKSPKVFTLAHGYAITQ
ncbi:MAG TPA: cytochrome c3 family protein [Blastocatellia bacterium]|nr:cytochrome c3 family protein [Blastocatellia bacterium]